MKYESGMKNPRNSTETSRVIPVECRLRLAFGDHFDDPLSNYRQFINIYRVNETTRLKFGT